MVYESCRTFPVLLLSSYSGRYALLDAAVSMNTTLADPDSLSIADAAEQVGLSRRTIERWISAGRLEASPSETDRRKRLVSLGAVQTLAAASRQRKMSDFSEPLTKTTDHSAAVIQGERVDSSSPPDDARDYWEVIDNVVQLTYSHHHRLIMQLYPDSFEMLSLDQLREGPLGKNLLRIAQVADGQLRLPRLLVLEAIETILQTLFWPTAADDYSVPRAFWDTDCGRMLSRAKYYSYDQSDLMSLGEAAEKLGVSRSKIYRWMDNQSLSYVRDDQSGRTFVVKRDVDNVKRITMDWQTSVSRNLEKVG